MQDELVEVMVSRPKVWSPVELCKLLGVNGRELSRMIASARGKGHQIKSVCDAQSGGSHKYWITA